MTNETSKVLTLVFTDLADSTALKSAHGDQAVDDLMTRHREHVSRLSEECAGRVIDWAGDGCFLTFDTSSAGVMFALRLQQAHADDSDLPSVRIGIHLGEVTEKDSPNNSTYVKGLAVDVAARVQGLAKPGQVLMSSAVYNSAKQRMGVDSLGQPILWQLHGLYDLKGFDHPIEIGEAGIEGVASFVAPPASEKARPAPQRQALPQLRHRIPIAAGSLIVLGALFTCAAWLSGLYPRAVSNVDDMTRTTSRPANVGQFDGRPAIAVLPFDNLSTDPEQAFFADGLADDLITRLASWRAFPVIARNSSFQYRGGDLDLKRVGAELSARYLVEGSVRRLGDRIRVTAQLIDAESAEHVWAESYDRAIEDVFALQDEIGSTIAASLVGDLTRAEGERARQQGTESLQAWSLYQLGLQHSDRFTAEDSIEAARLFERAAELDPRFATALARLALEKWVMMVGDGQAATDEHLDDARAIARRALELDPRDPVAHAAMGAVYLAAGDPKNAIDATRKAVDLNPSMPNAWIWFGWAQLLAGDPEACIVATERAQKLDPQGPMVWIYDSLALANWETGRYAAALEAGRRLVAVQPTYLTGYLYIAMSEVSLGNIEEAQAAIVEGLRVRPDLSINLMQNYLAVSRPEIDEQRNAALRTAGLE